MKGDNKNMLRGGLRGPFTLKGDAKNSSPQKCTERINRRKILFFFFIRFFFRSNLHAALIIDWDFFHPTHAPLNVQNEGSNLSLKLLSTILSMWCPQRFEGDIIGPHDAEGR